jgi:hypothetical protein
VNPENDWKFGVALWTFHLVSFPESLAKVDSSALNTLNPVLFIKQAEIKRLVDPAIIYSRH